MEFSKKIRFFREENETKKAVIHCERSVHIEESEHWFTSQISPVIMLSVSFTTVILQLKKPKRWQEQIILLIITTIQSNLYFIIQLGN